jgi:hypothetical protein
MKGPCGSDGGRRRYDAASPEPMYRVEADGLAARRTPPSADHHKPLAHPWLGGVEICRKAAHRTCVYAASSSARTMSPSRTVKTCSARWRRAPIQARAPRRPDRGGRRRGARRRGRGNAGARRTHRGCTPRTRPARRPPERLRRPGDRGPAYPCPQVPAATPPGRTLDPTPNLSPRLPGRSRRGRPRAGCPPRSPRSRRARSSASIGAGSPHRPRSTGRGRGGVR